MPADTDGPSQLLPAFTRYLRARPCVVNLPLGRYQGHDALDKICGELRASHPRYVYTPHNAPTAVQDGGRVDWGSGPVGEPSR